MSSLGVLIVLLAAIACPAQFSVVPPEEDFSFDITDFAVNFDGHNDGAGMRAGQETTATVGRTFHLVVPMEQFGPHARTLDAKRLGNKPLPSWLLFDKTSGTFWGVPLNDDLGPIQIIIKSIPKDKSTYQLTINVMENSDIEGVQKCPQDEDITLLSLLIDKSLKAVKPKQRVVAINNIAKFFGLPYSAFSMKPQTTPDDITDSSVVLAGPGNVKSKSSKVSSLLQVAVGCDGRLWDSTSSMVRQLKQQARDGTVSEVLGLPLIGWRIKTETRPIVRHKRELEDGSGNYDEYYDEYEDDYDNEDLDDDLNPPTNPPATTTSTTTTTTEATPTHPHRHHHGESIKPIDPSDTIFTEHHNHDQIPHTVPATLPPTHPSTTTASTTTTSTTVRTTTVGVPELTTSNDREIPKLTSSLNYDYDYYEEGDDSGDGPEESETEVPTILDKLPEIEVKNEVTSESTTTKETTKEVVPETVPTTKPQIVTEPTIVEEETTEAIVEDFGPPVYTVGETIPMETSTTEAPTTVSVNLTTTTSATTSATTTTTTTTTAATTTVSSTPMTTVTSPEPEAITEPIATTTEEQKTTQPDDTTTVKVTTARHVTESPRTSTTIREFIETTEIVEARNFKPFIENRLQQMSVMAGKIFRFVVPINAFKDFEDEYNLSLQFLDSNGENISKSSWCQFNPARREIYGLPLEKDISKWTYYVRATDTEGSYEQDQLTIQVQQHKMARVVNHEFSLHIRIEKQQEFPHYIDWSLKTLRALGKIYNTNMSEITVRSINASGELVVFTWSNDSIPTNYCPRSDILNLYKVLTANDRGDPSRELNLALAPELRVKKVTYSERGVCEQPTNPATPPVNFSPILRNPVDSVNATYGELLVYKVRDDTFYDPEDVDPRTLNISLLTATRQPIPPNNWLQFDSKNREFYGIPFKTSRTEYQLVCTDSGGLSVTDSLEVVVHQHPPVSYNVEFSMALETSYETFAHSASMQKKFVEKLMTLFNEPNSKNFQFLPFKSKFETTIVTWYNNSLPTWQCPTSEINRLESIMINKIDHGIAHRVHNIMDPEFAVSTIKIHLKGNCKIKVAPAPDVIPVDESTPQSGQAEYLVTFIVPVVIISIMLFVAAVAACVLYRRRRMSGKMNVEEDGRTSYGNKGIPVIFQEELEEKPEPGTKAPVILKDEKPPLAPPEYSKSGSVKLNDDSEPYQPPPPFTRTQDNGRQSRPKPTPTYRKPPPYVPP